MRQSLVHWILERWTLTFDPDLESWYKNSRELFFETTYQNKHFVHKNHDSQIIATGKHKQLQSMSLFYWVNVSKFIPRLPKISVATVTHLGMTIQLTKIMRPAHIPINITVWGISYPIHAWASIIFPYSLCTFFCQISIKWPWPLQKDSQGHL